MASLFRPFLNNLDSSYILCCRIFDRRKKMKLEIAKQIAEKHEKLRRINEDKDYTLLDTESRWTIWMWWANHRIDRDKLSEEVRKKILNIVDSCKESLWKNIIWLLVIFVIINFDTSKDQKNWKILILFIVIECNWFIY